MKPMKDADGSTISGYWVSERAMVEAIRDIEEDEAYITSHMEGV